MMLIVSIKEIFENQTAENHITLTTNQLHISSEAKYIIPIFLAINGLSNSYSAPDDSSERCKKIRLTDACYKSGLF